MNTLRHDLHRLILLILLIIVYSNRIDLFYQNFDYIYSNLFD